MEPFLQAVAQVGFPIAVAGYLLLRQEKTLKEMQDKFDARLDSIDKVLSGDEGMNVKLKRIIGIVEAIKRGAKKHAT